MIDAEFIKEVNRYDKLCRDYKDLFYEVSNIVHLYIDKDFKIANMDFDIDDGVFYIFGEGEYRPTHTVPAACVYCKDYDKVKAMMEKHMQREAKFNSMINDAANMLGKVNKLLEN